MDSLYQESGKNAAIDPVADLLGGGRVVAYKVDLGLALGSATAGLWLSQMWFWANTAETERTNKKRWDGDWVCWSQDEITAQTALTRRESDTARRDLKAVGVLEEAKRGLPARVWYRLDKTKLNVLLRDYCDKKTRQPRLAETYKLGKPGKRMPLLNPNFPYNQVWRKTPTLMHKTANLYRPMRQPSLAQNAKLL